MAKKITILDYSSTEVHVFTFDPNKYEDGEHFLSDHFDSQGNTFKESQCHWMISGSEDEDLELGIFIHI